MHVEKWLIVWMLFCAALNVQSNSGNPSKCETGNIDLSIDREIDF